MLKINKSRAKKLRKCIFNSSCSQQSFYFSFAYKGTGRGPLNTFLGSTPNYQTTSLALMSLQTDQFITSEGLICFINLIFHLAENAINTHVA